jgi:hypothetical protein
VIATTPEHQFWVKDEGWKLAAELQVGDLLSSHDGHWVAVEDLFDTGEYQVVYNLRVGECHTYFVGATEWGFGLWAHNDYDQWRTHYKFQCTEVLQNYYANAEQNGVIANRQHFKDKILQPIDRQGDGRQAKISAAHRELEIIARERSQVLLSLNQPGGGGVVIPESAGYRPLKPEEVAILQRMDYDVRLFGNVVHTRGDAFYVTHVGTGQVSEVREGQVTLYRSRSNDNHQYAGQSISVTYNGTVVQVPMTRDAFPMFEGFAYTQNGHRAIVDIDMVGGTADFVAARAKYRELIGDPFFDEENLGIRHTWHHHQNRRTMILVPRDIHSISHTGGEAYIRQFGRL